LSLAIERRSSRSRSNSSRSTPSHAASSDASRDAPPPAYEKQVCLDLLAAKQEALDRRAPFPMPPDFCGRCRAVFASMDLVADTCNELGDGDLPPAVRDALAKRIANVS